MRLSLKREVCGSNFGLVKSDTMLQRLATVATFLRKELCKLPGCNDAEVGAAYSLHALAYYSEYNERFDF